MRQDDIFKDEELFEIHIKKNINGRVSIKLMRKGKFVNDKRLVMTVLESCVKQLREEVDKISDEKKYKIE